MMSLIENKFSFNLLKNNLAGLLGSQKMNNTKAQAIDVPRKWHVEQIKAAVRMSGTTLKSLSLANGLPPASCSFALNNPHQAAEIVIAQFLGVPPHELWPDRWTADGRRIRPRYAHLYFNGKAA